MFLNGNILGVHRRPKHFVRSFREMRRRGRVKEFVSVYMQHHTVHIASDGGRVCRPLIICDHGVPRVKEGHLQVMCRVQFWVHLFVFLFISFNHLVSLLQLLRNGKWNFNSFLRNGLLEYLGGPQVRCCSAYHVNSCQPWLLYPCLQM